MTIGAEALAVVYRLVSALTWGAGNFTGGLASRRANPFSIVAISQAVSLLLFLALAQRPNRSLQCVSGVEPPPAFEYLHAIVACIGNDNPVLAV